MFKKNKKLLALFAVAIAVPSIYADTEEKNESRFGIKTGLLAGTVFGGSTAAAVVVTTFKKAITETTKEFLNNRNRVGENIQNEVANSILSHNNSNVFTLKTFMDTHPEHKMPSLENAFQALQPNVTLKTELAKTYIGQGINKITNFMPTEMPPLNATSPYVASTIGALYTLYQFGIFDYFLSSNNTDNQNNETK